MPIASNEVYNEMLDRAKAGAFAYPAINCTSSQSIVAAIRGFAEAESDGIVQISWGGAEFASGQLVKDMVAGATALLTFVKLLPDSESHPFEVHGDVAPGFWINLLWCAVAAVLAAGVGRIAQELIPRVRSFAVTRLPGGALALGLVSGSVLAISAMVTPIILFSGHHETQSLLDGSHSTMALVGLAFLKVIVVVACLAGGWYGGQIFPIAFVGAAIALAFGQLVHSPSTLALTAAGYVAANVVTLRKPLLVVIIFIFFFPPTAWLAMVIAAGIAVAFTSDEAPATSH